ncbi:MAG: FHA domain-containing protein [Actinomycetaceae bacterium]|nr:FHA domain-containing protein [Arcanobacterium sp.]MDD7686457.1 FHA domain-containing protein [Actinomycetaceae bacterium]MDY5272737.1 FHA domain-containing protein [Arcanobacterium sp.]
MGANESAATPASATPDPTATSRFSAIRHGSADISVPVPLHGLDADDLAAIEALPPTSALLIARRGPNAGARFLLNSDETTAGRHPKSDIFLDDVTVSRRHAHFLRRDGVFFVKDMGSLNGTYVNGELVDEAQLQTNDEVRIGKYQFTYFASTQAV